jgi:hypothetical protein
MLITVLLTSLLPAGDARAGGPSLAVDPPTARCSSAVLVRGSGWPPGRTVRVQRGSDNGVVLGQATSGPDGAFVMAVVPCAADAGSTEGTRITLLAGSDQAAGGNSPPLHSTATFTVGATCRTFPETGKTVCGRFLDYWTSHGGLMQQGYPISDEVLERSDTDGQTYRMQYFERAVFELHPENAPPYDVLLALLGAQLYNIQYPGGAAGQQPNPAPGSQYFPQTGHRVGGAFLSYWQQHGGLAQQGYPLSDEFQERSALDGKPYTVQYFERAVFEYHPENHAPYDVLLSQLGTFRYRTRPGGAPGGYPGKIVFDTMTGDTAPTVVVINPDGTGRATIAAGHSPVFGPDGGHLAFVAPVQAPAAPGAPWGQVALRTTNLDGSQPQDRCRTAGNAQIDLVRWSPRNRSIALNAGQNPPGAIYLCDLGSGTLGTLVMTGNGPATEVFDWSGDETARLWQAPGPRGDLELYYGNSDVAEGARPITTGENRPGPSGLRHYRAARLSPDGNTIAIAGSVLFFRSVPGRQSALNGTVLAGLREPSALAWAPDGRALAVVDQATHILYVADVATGRLTTLATDVGRVDWSPR